MWIKNNSKLLETTFITVIVLLVLLSQHKYYLVEGRALTNSSRFSIESNSIQRDIIETQKINDFSRSLKRVYVSNRTVTCNDGSQSGFYLRKSPASKKWVVFLEGGWHCTDTKSCRARWLKLRHLMTSAQWPETRDVGGILSPILDENPYWYNANHVLVPYCSSDSWSGSKGQADTRDGWRFMGSLIVRQVIADLIPLGLGRTSGSELLLVGSSAGGLGVMLNLDRISNFLHIEKNLKVLVRGVSDSGWFLDREPYTPDAVAASESVRQGWKMWEGSLPESCVKHHTTEPWRCYYGYRLYPTLKSPLFVFQWLFDEAQMRADNVGAPVTRQQWNYIHEMGGALRQSLDNVTAVFAPSCIGHAVLSKRDWLNIKIDDISLPEALRCWEQSTRRKHNKLRRASDQPKRNDKKRRHNQKHRHNEDNNGNNNNNNNNNNNGNGSGNGDGNNKKLTKEEREQRRRHNERKRNHRRLLRTTQQPKNNKSFTDSKINNNNNNDNISNNNDSTTIATNNNKKHRKNLYNFNGNNNNNNNGPNNNNNNSHSGNNNSNNGNKKKRRRNQNRQHQYQREQEDQHQQQSIPFNKQQNYNQNKSHQQQHHHNNNNNNNNNDRIKLNEPKKCSLRLLERCSWPQCNHSCPTLTNPVTGEEMRVLELLTSFGLNMEDVAKEVGFDMQTLNNMDQTELVNLLTQRNS